MRYSTCDLYPWEVEKQEFKAAHLCFIGVSQRDLFRSETQPVVNNTAVYPLPVLVFPLL